MSIRITDCTLRLSCVGLVGIACLTPTLATLAQNQGAPQLPSTTLSGTVQRQQHRTQGVIFETPSGFSEVKSLGGNTVGVTYPAAGGARRVAVRLLELDPDVLGMTSLGPREFSEYVRYRFFGITTRPQSYQTRQFLGQPVMGEVLMQPQSGSMSYLELYLVPLSQTRQLAIAFEADTELPVQLLERTIKTMESSLREDPKAKRKKKRNSFSQF